MKKTFLNTTKRQFSSGPKTFKVLGLQQIAIGNTDKQVLTDFWVNKLGIAKVGDFKSERENVDEDILKLGNGPFAVEIDLMAPLEAGKKPDVSTPPLNHIGLWIDNLENAVTELEANDVKMAPGGIRLGASGYNITFIHPKFSGKVLVELVQAPDNVIEAFKTISEA